MSPSTFKLVKESTHGDILLNWFWFRGLGWSSTLSRGGLGRSSLCRTLGRGALSLFQFLEANVGASTDGQEVLESVGDEVRSREGVWQVGSEGEGSESLDVALEGGQQVISVDVDHVFLQDGA